MDGELTVDSAAALLDGLVDEAPAEATEEEEQQQAQDSSDSEQTETEETEESEGDESDEEYEDGDEESDGDSEEDDEEEVEEAGQKLKLTIDGKEVEMPAEEVAKAIEQNTELHRDNTEFAQWINDARTYIPQLVERNKRLESLLTDELAELKGVDLEALAVEDPATYVQVTHRMKVLEGLEADRESKNQAAASSNFAAEQGKLVKAMPELSNPEKAKAFKEDLVGYLKEIGFTDSEMAIGDHRHFLIIRDALKYRELNTKTTKVIEAVKQKKPKTAPKNIRPGSANTAHKSQTGDALRRLSKTGSVDDAATAIAKLI